MQAAQLAQLLPRVPAVSAFEAGFLLVMALLSYLFVYRQPTDEPRDAPEEYFQRIVDQRDDLCAAFAGKADGYSWTQTDDEVEVVARVPSGTRASDVRCRVTPTALDLVVSGNAIVHGTLTRRVQSDESDWALEGEGSGRLLRLSLAKQVPTKGSQHWRSLLAEPG